jgi:hypothetical protein
LSRFPQPLRNIFFKEVDEEEENNTGESSTLFKELWVLFGGILF